jgi:hypothetical protein
MMTAIQSRVTRRKVIRADSAVSETPETQTYRARSDHSGKHCTDRHGKLRRIGEEVSERYEYIPAQMTVIEDVCIGRSTIR